MNSITKNLKRSADDITENLVGKRLQCGLNILEMNGAETLVIGVRATEGKLLEYVITDANGCPVKETTSITQKTKKKTTCWECGTDAKGNTHCWKVPCPVIVGPWSPGKVVQVGFTLG